MTEPTPDAKAHPERRSPCPGHLGRGQVLVIEQVSAGTAETRFKVDAAASARKNGAGPD
jgi:hypothetical protein